MILLKSKKGSKGKIHIKEVNSEWALCHMVRKGHCTSPYKISYIEDKGIKEDVTCGVCLSMLEKENNER